MSLKGAIAGKRFKCIALFRLNYLNHRCKRVGIALTTSSYRLKNVINHSFCTMLEAKVFYRIFPPEVTVGFVTIKNRGRLNELEVI